MEESAKHMTHNRYGSSHRRSPEKIDVAAYVPYDVM